MKEEYGVLEKRVFDSEVRFLGTFCFEPYNVEQYKVLRTLLHKI